MVRLLEGGGRVDGDGSVVVVSGGAPERDGAREGDPVIIILLHSIHFVTRETIPTWER